MSKNSTMGPIISNIISLFLLFHWNPILILSPLILSHLLYQTHLKTRVPCAIWHPINLHGKLTKILNVPYFLQSLDVQFPHLGKLRWTYAKFRWPTYINYSCVIIENPLCVCFPSLEERWTELIYTDETWKSGISLVKKYVIHTNFQKYKKQPDFFNITE